MSEPQDKNDKPGQDPVLAFITLIVSLIVSFTALHFIGIAVPKLKERWNFETPFAAMFCVGLIAFVLAAVVSVLPFAGAKTVSKWLFVGLFVPWVLRFLFAFAEFIHGAGI